MVRKALWFVGIYVLGVVVVVAVAYGIRAMVVV